MTLGLALALTLAQTNPSFVDEVLERWDGTGISVDVVSVRCGEENAYYFPEDKVVVLCTELFARPLTARFVLGHELGHAWMDQHGVPGSERGADELALITSPIDEAYAAAVWFMEMGQTASGNDGVHQSHMDRAATFMCVADGLWDPEHATRTCRVYADSVYEHWQRVVLMLP